MKRWVIQHKYGGKMESLCLAWRGASGFGWVKVGDPSAATFDSKDEAEVFIGQNKLWDYGVAKRGEINDGDGSGDVIG